MEKSKAKNASLVAPAADSSYSSSVVEAQGSFLVVGIGSSAGGMEAFTEFLKKLPPKTGMAFVYVQHQEPKHESSLAEILSRATSIPVRVVTDRMRIEPDRVYVMPAEADVSIRKYHLHLEMRQSHGLHLPIDSFFKSLAETWAHRVIGVVLSGAGSDGTAGLQAIREAGGITFAQAPETARYDAMPRSAISAGAVDFILPPGDIAQELTSVAQKLNSRDRQAPSTKMPTSEERLKPIFTALQRSFGVDFSQYKMTTVLRRLGRRMALRKIDTVDDYAEYLSKHPQELDALYDEMLIHVTSFFRDPETYETLKTEILPKVFRTEESASLRMWVPGCSTGEECYSLAIAVLEYLGQQATSVKIQIFGTDVSARSVSQARAGVYPSAIATDVGPERLRRFFQKTDRGYEIAKAVRDICIFARHNVVKDPPFSKVDLISCRNLLIYLGATLQKRIIPLFHYALNPGGYLVLGTAETIGNFSEFFYPADKKHRVYARRTVPGRVHFDAYSHFPTEGLVAARLVAPERSRAAEIAVPQLSDALKEGDRLILSRYAPAAVIVNDQLEILQFRGQVSPYLEPAQGQASLHLLKMAREGLMVELRSAIQAVRKKNGPVTREGLHVRREGKIIEFNLEIVPFKFGRSSENFFLVLFQKATRTRGATEKKTSAKPAKGRGKGKAEDYEAELLRQELHSTKEYLQSIIEEQEAVNEELKAANEEILSSNEELQSTNEELETAKEELQSANEELTTLNEELQTRNVELGALNNDMNNLFAAVQIPIIMLGGDLRIRRFTTLAEKTLNLLPSDIGRPITDINLNIKVENLDGMIMETIDNVLIQEREVQDRKDSWYRLQIRPYKTMENKIDGAVVLLFDIDELKKRALAMVRLAAANDAMMETVRHPIIILDNLLHIISANSSFYRTFQVPRQEVENRGLFEVGDGALDSSKFRTFIELLREGKQKSSPFQFNHATMNGKRKIKVTGRVLQVEDEKMVLLTFQPT